MELLEYMRPNLQNEIDLHGLRHEEARNALIRKIEDLWGSDETLEIITGHSDRMKEIAIKVLDEYKLEARIPEMWDSNQGSIKTTVW